MKRQLSTSRLVPKKSLGQNFIIDQNFLSKINRNITTNKKNTLIEIGPGKGALTGHLLQKQFKKIYLIEKDKVLYDLLIKKYQLYKNIIVINDDALLYNFKAFNKIKNVIIIGNLPFNISTKLLILWLRGEEWPSFFDKMVLMFQKEVAERIIASKNNKKYGRLSILVQSRCKVSKLFDAPATIFSPKPKVDGTILQFEPIKKYNNVNFDKLEKLLELSFSSRRKKIKTTLKNHSRHLLDLNIDINLRPENLSVSQYCNLAKLID